MKQLLLQPQQYEYIYKILLIFWKITILPFLLGIPKCWYISLSRVKSIVALPETREHNGHSLWLALLPNHDFIKEPTTASSAAVMSHTHPAHLTQGHGLNEELVMLRGVREKTDSQCKLYSCIFCVHLLINNTLTFPFSNLLTLFLLIIMSRSPVSPRSPITLRKTLASVPLPPTSPVQMVTRYLITGGKRESNHIILSTYCTFSAISCTLHYRLVTWRLWLFSVHLSQGRGSLMRAPESGWKLSDDLIVVFIDVQPAATLKRIFLHRQGLKQSDLNKNTSVSVTYHHPVVSLYLKVFLMDCTCLEATSITTWFAHKSHFKINSNPVSDSVLRSDTVQQFEQLTLTAQADRVMGLTFAKCQPENGFLFSCQMRNFSGRPVSGISTYRHFKRQRNNRRHMK